MNRAAIYARFSTDLQNERSVEDQIDLCRAYAGREGLQVVAKYQDKAKSGASVLGRDGLYNLLQDAQAKKFDVIVVEALDRLSRDMEDLAGMYKRLKFHGIEIRAVHEGVASTILVGLRGLVGQLYREDNVHKVRRGMSGLIKQGLYAGGRAYGYRPDPMNKGKLLIVEEEAEIVRRIFREFVEGKSPRKIAHDLNKEAATPPRGTKWNASTINGNLVRGNGILLNSIYVGKLVWNRVQMVKDPDTGKRISRPNPPEEWQSRDVPELQIVPTDIWEAAQEHKKSRAHVPATLQKRPKRLLSGMLRCGACGSGMSTVGKDKSGRPRLRCSAAAESGSCPDPKTFYLEKVESLVLNTLAAELKDPKLLVSYLEKYIEERQALAQEIIKNRSTFERQLSHVLGEMDRLVTSYQKSFVEEDVLAARMPVLRAERDTLKELLAAQPEVPKSVMLHPQALQQYEEQLSRLAEAVHRGLESGDNPKGVEVLRKLIKTVTVYRDDSKVGGVKVEIRGELNPLVGLEANSRTGVGIDGSGRRTRTADLGIMRPS
ncbi:MAG: recombinase family protein, partial [Burkholderiaceae bacterium]|nr:recombinase family protein [Burkholderiaceae bacterium]